MTSRFEGENGSIDVVTVKFSNGLSKSSNFSDKLFSSGGKFVSESLIQMDEDSYKAKGVITFSDILKMRSSISFDSDGKTITNAMIVHKK
jgi:hypothetical protein